MLFLLERIGETDYDEANVFVIRAKTEKEAREMCVQSRSMDDLLFSKEPEWLDPLLTTCKVLKSTGKSEVICEDFKGG